MKNRSALRAALPAALALCLVALPAAAVPQDVADVTTGITQVEWTPHHGYAGFRLVVSGPDGVVERHFDGGDRPLFSLAELSVASDGMYKWTLTGTPELPNAAIAELKAEGDAPNRGLVTRSASDLPTRMSGSFRVVDGAIVQRDLREEPGARLAPDRASGGGAAAANAPLSRATAADQVIPDDLIVQSSLCVGFDCVNGESFGFDTIRLKENNLRIKFQDTSAGSFPTVDWQLTANESTNGGLSKFSIEQIDPSPSIPFTIEAGAGSHALYVDDGERVGLSTNSPVVELHIVDGDTPTIRLDQDTSSGFQSQVWDIAGNETNFFVRDVSSGSLLPFRIRPGAPTSSIDVAASGSVGVGTTSPDGLQVNVAVTETADGNDNIRLGIAGGTPRMVFEDAGFPQWQIDNLAGTFRWFQSGNVGMVIEADRDVGLQGCQQPDHDLIIGGSGAGCNTGTYSEIDAGEPQFDVSSSRSIKEKIAPVRVDNILDRIAGVDVYSYDFIDGPTDRIGLMAEDFHQIFGRGSDKVLSGTEVQLALWLAVQELADENKELRQAAERSEELEERLAHLEEMLEGR